VPWLFRTVSNPAANSIVVDVKANVPTWNKIFNVHGIYIAHNATAAKRYQVETFREGTNETNPIFVITVPANSLPFLFISEYDPIVGAVGAFTGGYAEHFRIRAVDGGEPSLTVGILMRGGWVFESGYGMRG